MTSAPAPVVTFHGPLAEAALTSTLYTPTGVLAGTAMTAAGAEYDDTLSNSSIRAFYLIGLTSELGSNTCSCTTSSDTSKVVACMAFSGVSQTAPEVLRTISRTTTDPAANSVTTVADNAFALNFINFGPSTGTCAPGDSETEIYERIATGNHTACGYYLGPVTPAGATSMDVDFNSAAQALHWGMSIAPAATSRERLLFL